MAFYLQALSQNEQSYEGFFDGQQKTIPDQTVLTVGIIDGFNGYQEGRSLAECWLKVKVLTEGEYYGQVYRYNAKIYDMDAGKRDLAMKNLGVVDRSVGFPLTKGQLPLDQESINENWAFKAKVRAKFGLLIGDDGKEVNFIRGFAHVIQSTQEQPVAPQPVAPQPEPVSAVGEMEDIGF